MLRQVADGVHIHASEFLQSNTLVVQGRDGVLLIDPGVKEHEILCLAGDLRELNQPVVAGFSTHPHWDHLLWHEVLGEPPRFGTARCTIAIQASLSLPNWKDAISAQIPRDVLAQVPLDLLGAITGLAAEVAQLPWDGTHVRIVEHQAHAPGHAALLIEEHGVLVTGDMLSDVLVPLLDFNDTANPIEDYLAALQLIEAVVDDIDIFVPGHGSVGGPDQLQARIDQDRAYVLSLRDASALSDPRIGPSAESGWEWVGDVHASQLRILAERSGRLGTRR